MNVLEHNVLRARPNSPGLPQQASPPVAPGATEASNVPVDSFRRSPVLDEAMPDLSGFANFSRQRLLAVRDSKDNSPDARVLFVNKNSGAVSDVEMDWSRTGVARDLEAVTPNAHGGGRFLAVEGSSFGEKKARLFELSVGDQAGQSEKSHVLPDFGQEIEGITSVKGEDGKQTVLFAGRGGEGDTGRIFWGELDGDGLRFNEDGLTGQAVQAPTIGEGQRDLAELVADKNGNLWGTAAIDTGDTGNFTSAVYQLGRLTPGAKTPFEAKLGAHYPVNHIKAEALAIGSNGKFFVGSDNESFGGRIDTLG